MEQGKKTIFQLKKVTDVRKKEIKYEISSGGKPETHS